MGAANGLVFLIAVIIAIIVAFAVFHGVMATYTGGVGILGFLAAILIAIGGRWLTDWAITNFVSEAKS